MKRGVLELTLTAYCLASLLHFVHNGVYLDSYPNLPSSITAAVVAWSWLGIASIGAVGYALLRFGWTRAGLLTIAIYAAFGFDGFAHYAVARMSEHTLAMNLTIWAEALMAAMLLVIVVVTLARLPRAKALHA